MRSSIFLLLVTTAAIAAPLMSPGARGLDVRSAAFGPDEAIPAEYTCDGGEQPPPLHWSTPPRATKSLALLVEDPDAPGGTFAHWIVTELRPQTIALRGGAPIPRGAVAGINDAGDTGWTPPCPQAGMHHYVFHVYALDTRLGTHPMTRAGLLNAIDGHVLAQGKLVGTYEKHR